MAEDLLLLDLPRAGLQSRCPLDAVGLKAACVSHTNIDQKLLLETQNSHFWLATSMISYSLLWHFSLTTTVFSLQRDEQEEFDWFCDLLSAAAEGPAAGDIRQPHVLGSVIGGKEFSGID